MKIIKLKNIEKSKLIKIKQRSFRNNNDISSVVNNTLSQVKKNKDKLIIEKYEKRFGKGNYSIAVSKNEIKNAYKNIDKKYLRAINQAIKNIKTVSKYQFANLKEVSIETSKGIKLWREWRPIEKVGLYIPGGKAIYPSSVLMTGIPAVIAGCKEIIICSPPNKEGKIPNPILVAVDMISIKKIYKVGGVEAIGAMSYGTETIPKVYKIYGAGNSYVTEAKMQVFGEVDIDMPAGPSEVFIIADELANPSFIAADLLADGEHGEDSACVLLTTSERLANEVNKEITKQLKTVSTADRIKKSLKNYGLLGLVDSVDEAIDFCNDYAPEHLEIMTKNSERLVSKVTNAGSVFLGSWTTKSAGDYATGANHVLPTGGMAKIFPPLSVGSFGKMMEIQKVSSKNALKRIRDTIETLAEIEGLPAHKNSSSIRFQTKRGEK
ncbi:MAG: histidinol dehydrogenase [Candidatus Levybacteria bacterium]|nr:histidinol dehydrogenase [Candidatus Levybacteria bacterium]